MNKINSTELHLTEIALNDQTKFRLNEINKIKYYFNSKIQERKTMSKRLSKHIDAFDYAVKIFIVSSATFGTLRVVSHATVVGIPIGLAGASLTAVFSLTTVIIKKLLNVTRKKKKRKLLCLLRVN